MKISSSKLQVNKMDCKDSEIKIELKEVKELTGKVRSVFITINNPIDKEIEAIKAITSYRYMVIGKHVGEKSKLPHIHALVDFKNPRSLKALKKLLPRANLQRKISTSSKCKEYINKDKNIIYEDGKMPMQGCRFEAIRTDILDGLAVKDIIEEYPEEYIKYHAGIEKMHALLSDTTYKQILELYKDTVWRKWQTEMLEYVKKKPHDRKVRWIIDTEGNGGKTFLAQYLMVQHGAAYFTNSKTVDIVCAYEGQRIVIFDLARSNEERVNYQVIEQIKNGIMFSPKYQSKTKMFMKPHVIIFSNFAPEKHKLSMDRWDIINIATGSDKEDGIII